MRVYVAAAFRDWRRAAALAGLLRRSGIQTTSSWHDTATDSITDATLSREQRRSICRRNRSDLRHADALVLIASEHCRGALMELERAHGAGDCCVVVGTPETLTVMADLDGLIWVDTDAAAVATLERRLYR